MGVFLVVIYIGLDVLIEVKWSVCVCFKSPTSLFIYLFTLFIQSLIISSFLKITLSIIDRVVTITLKFSCDKDFKIQILLAPSSKVSLQCSQQYCQDIKAQT